MIIAAALSMVTLTAGSAASASSGPAAASNDPILTQLQKAGTVRIAMGDEPPYTEVYANGTVGGIMVDVVKAVMRKLGVPRITAIVTTYAAVIPGIEAGRYTIGAAGTFYTTSRCQQVLFSNPVVVTRSAFAVKQGNPLGINSYSWFLSHSGKLGLITPSAEQEYAQSLKIPSSKELDVPDLTTGLSALEYGRIQALAADELSLSGAGKAVKFQSVITTDGPKAGAGEIFAKANGAFRNAFNTAYKQIIANGTYAKIAKSFNIDPTVAPHTTASELAPGCTS